MGAALAFCVTGAARADEVVLGAYAHDVDTFISSHSRESGADIEVAYRTAPFDELRAIGRPMVVLELFGNTASARASCPFRSRPVRAGS